MTLETTLTILFSITFLYVLFNTESFILLLVIGILLIMVLVQLIEKK